MKDLRHAQQSLTRSDFCAYMVLILMLGDEETAIAARPNSFEGFKLVPPLQLV